MHGKISIDKKKISMYYLNFSEKKIVLKTKNLSVKAKKNCVITVHPKLFIFGLPVVVLEILAKKRNFYFLTPPDQKKNIYLMT